jgi:hypothetical protein
VANDGVQADGVDFAARVAPILRERCLSCHGPAKSKGNLRLDRRELVFGEDPDAWVVVPGKPEESELFRLVTLPENDLDRMPGKGDPLGAEQIDVLREWISEGAVWPPEFVIETESAPSGARAETPAPQHASPPEAAPRLASELLAAIRARGAHAAPIAQDETQVEVNLSLAREPMGDADLALLDGMQAHLVWLNLARTAVSDAGLERLGSFGQLKRLHLERTPITDAGLAHLAGLEQLEYLNLYATAVSDAGLLHLRGLRGLRRLFVWRTAVTEDGIEALRAALPQLEVIGAAELELPLEAATEEAPSLPECCAAAQAQGGECAHACCVEARAANHVCETCLRR